ncbi:MAG: hypothetical protein QOD72_3132, partial [Acidimicrobiaceae bacterium]|nr:hypothetical protein [Acidimicrobiaceae bacterium]
GELIDRVRAKVTERERDLAPAV